MKDIIERKSKSLKAAIDRYNTYKRFIDSYKKTKRLDDYITYIRLNMSSMSESVAKYYEKIISDSERGESAKLITNLFDKYLDAAEHKDKVSDELKSVLSEVKHESKTK